MPMDADGCRRSMLGTEITEGSDRDHRRHPPYFSSCCKHILFLNPHSHSVTSDVKFQEVTALKMVSRNRLYTYKVKTIPEDTIQLRLADRSLIQQGGPRSIGILAVAYALGFDIEVVETNPQDGLSEEYLKLNRLGKTPTFVSSDGTVLTECMAIALHGKNHPDPLPVRVSPRVR